MIHPMTCECKHMGICEDAVEIWNQAAALFEYYEAQPAPSSGEPTTYRWAIGMYATARKLYTDHNGRQLPWHVRPFRGHR